MAYFLQKKNCLSVLGWGRLEMHSLAASLGTSNPKRVNRHDSLPNRGLPISELAPTVKISTHFRKDFSLQLQVDEKPKPSLFGRREIIGFGSSFGLLDALFQLHPTLAAAEGGACDFTVATSGLAFCDKVVGYGPEASKGQLIKVNRNSLPILNPIEQEAYISF